MKNRIIFSLLIFCYFLNYQSAESIDVKANDYSIVTDTVADNSSNYEILKENESVLIIRKNNKIGVMDKQTGSFIGQQNIDEIEQFAPNNEKEYKIKIKNYVGYLNTDTKTCFLSKYDDMFLTDKYIKIKKDGKFGLIDKDGNIILNPIFEKVGVSNNDNKEYLTGAIDGKVKLFYNTGKVVTENEFYTSAYKKNYTLARDLKPIIKSYRIKGSTIYKLTPAEQEEQVVYQIEEIPVKNKVHTAAIHKNETAIMSNNPDTDLFTAGKKNFIVVNENHKIGLNDTKNNEIIPAVYNRLNVKTPCEKHPNFKVIAAEKNHAYTLYDLKGKVLAEQVYNKINIYKYGKIYTYSYEDGKWVLRQNTKTIGTLTLNGSDYKFEKQCLHIRSLHKINELLITFLKIA